MTTQQLHPCMPTVQAAPLKSLPFAAIDPCLCSLVLFVSPVTLSFLGRVYECLFSTGKKKKSQLGRNSLPLRHSHGEHRSLELNHHTHSQEPSSGCHLHPSQTVVPVISRQSPKSGLTRQDGISWKGGKPYSQQDHKALRSSLFHCGCTGVLCWLEGA